MTRALRAAVLLSGERCAGKCRMTVGAPEKTPETGGFSGGAAYIAGKTTKKRLLNTLMFLTATPMLFTVPQKCRKPDRHFRCDLGRCCFRPIVFSSFPAAKRGAFDRRDRCRCGYSSFSAACRRAGGYVFPQLRSVSRVFAALCYEG